MKRLTEAMFAIWAIATVTFVLLRFLPGGPFDQERALPPEIKAQVEANYGLDQPLAQQYLLYFKALARGDLGESIKYSGQPVATIIGETFPVSLQLGFLALLLSFLLGVPLGVLAAAKHRSVWDHVAVFGASSGVALPNFIVGPLLVLVFSLGVPFESLNGLLPAALWDSPSHFILPVLTLGLRPTAMIARLTRASMLEVIQADFVRTARAKGLPHHVILFKHVLKNSMIPLLTISGPLIAGLLSGSMVVETIFAVPGMGKHFVQSVTNRDYPLVLGLTLVFSTLLILSNLLVDLLYTLVDPRVKLR